MKEGRRRDTHTKGKKGGKYVTKERRKEDGEMRKAIFGG